MSPTALEKFRQRLQQQLVEVSAEISAHSDPASEVESAIVQSDDALLRKIELALQRIGEGSYGKCSGCGGDIPLARLEAKPSASLCTACQEAKEKGGH